MKVSEAMTRDVRVANPDQSIREAARTMAEIDTGVLPVGESDRLVGILSLGDLAVMQGAGPAGEALTGVSQPGGEHSQIGGPRS